MLQKVVGNYRIGKAFRAPPLKISAPLRTYSRTHAPAGKGKSIPERYSAARSLCVKITVRIQIVFTTSLSCKKSHKSHTYSPPAVLSPFAQALNTFFLIFPVLVFGSSSTTSHSFGTINRDIAGCSLHHCINSSFVIFFPAFTVMNAFGRSPHCSSDTAATPHSRISGWVTITDSRATDEMFSPPASVRTR